MYDYLVVGCGFFGSVFAQQAKENGKSVMMIDRRPHIGGNCYSYDYEDTNISVHKYGSHIFHCSDDDTWNYINRFTEFNRYRHRVLTTRQGEVYSMPINLGTINSFFGTNLKPNDVPSFLDTQRTFTGRPANLEEQAISLIGKPLYETFFYGYTRKQWGCEPRELPASINHPPARAKLLPRRLLQRPLPGASPSTATRPYSSACSKASPSNSTPRLLRQPRRVRKDGPRDCLHWPHRSLLRLLLRPPQLALGPL